MGAIAAKNELYSYADDLDRSVFLDLWSCPLRCKLGHTGEHHRGIWLSESFKAGETNGRSGLDQAVPAGIARLFVASMPGCAAKRIYAVAGMAMQSGQFTLLRFVLCRLSLGDRDERGRLADPDDAVSAI